MSTTAQLTLNRSTLNQTPRISFVLSLSLLSVTALPFPSTLALLLRQTLVSVLDTSYIVRAFAVLYEDVLYSTAIRLVVWKENRNALDIQSNSLSSSLTYITSKLFCFLLLGVELSLANTYRACFQRSSLWSIESSFQGRLLWKRFYSTPTDPCFW